MVIARDKWMEEFLSEHIAHANLTTVLSAMNIILRNSGDLKSIHMTFTDRYDPHATAYKPKDSKTLN